MNSLLLSTSSDSRIGRVLVGLLFVVALLILSGWLIAWLSPADDGEERERE